MLMDFYGGSRSLKELATALEVLRDFRESESFAESRTIPVEHWQMADVLEDILAHLVEGQPLCADTQALLLPSRR